MSSSSSSNSNTTNARRSSSSRGGRVELTAYFFSVLGLFAVATVLLNVHTAYSTTHLHQDAVAAESSALESYLKLAFIDSKMKNTAKKKQQQLQKKPQSSSSTTSTSSATSYSLAGLSCDKYGGPSNEVAREMVYWKDIPQDSFHVSPFKKPHTTQYLTFEPDHGGFNNIRMAFETTIALSFGMGRTLVLPPEQEMYLLGKKKHGKTGQAQRNTFSFQHFFHMAAIHDEHVGLDIITMQTFLEREAMTGRMRHVKTGEVVFPPNNRTNWDGEPQPIFEWLRTVARVVVWIPEDCLAVFPATPDAASMQELERINATIFNSKSPVRWEDYVGKPVPVDAAPLERLKENLANRERLCVYDQTMQAASVLHFPTGRARWDDNKEVVEARLLVHFYIFLFFQDWNQDLWMKRFMRDHVRFIDEIQCAAARVVQAVREHVRKRNGGTGGNIDIFDTMHVRRGDFQYKEVRVSAENIYQQTKRILPENGTVFIATDERDKSFFEPLRQHYDILFLDDFHEALGDINSNYYGMVDVLVATRGRYFFGCWFSTFTGYINRLRGYHSVQDKYPGHEQGIIPSWYYARDFNFDHMQSFYPVKQAFYAREFPTAWRNIDFGLQEFHNKQQQ